MAIDWEREKQQKKLERESRKLARIMAAPASRQEVLNGENDLRMNVASTAIAIEALETLLIAKGILHDNEVLDQMKVLMEQKKEQVAAAQAQAEPPKSDSRIIIPV